ncbi:hypothetical protein LOK49_LG08G02515 [Camellia lanceoleosa]|uniref:Uncharacterized protein n=1 Tax=Camellia lanceoleosa TaxID=1840588 RepID=A0ACC0GY62_9ERIC|nr:hypothetical protein LOK49_LG08G02515 [Camellia lanceoleosa]
MSLVDLASAESGQISYPLIKDTLQVNDDEVEIHCTERIFGKHQWQTLREKLATWRMEEIFYVVIIAKELFTQIQTQSVMILFLTWFMGGT